MTDFMTLYLIQLGLVFLSMMIMLTLNAVSTDTYYHTSNQGLLILFFGGLLPAAGIMIFIFVLFHGLKFVCSRVKCIHSEWLDKVPLKNPNSQIK